MEAARADDAASAWLAQPEFPTSEELMASVPAGPRDFGPGGKVTYLATQHSVLRHEGTELLRRAIAEYRARPSMKDTDSVLIYTNVHVLGYMPCRLGALCRVGFSTERSPTRVRWDVSTRLTPGDLVALSPVEDKFAAVCHVATVGRRILRGGLEPDLEPYDPQAEGEDPDTTPPRIDLLWASPADVIIDPAREYVMVATQSGYYESVRHALRGLASAANEDNRLNKYISGDCCDEVVRPQYLTDHLEAGGLINAQLNGYPLVAKVDADIASLVGNASCLDPSQLNALTTVLSSEMVLIQGPPGTGKTFTSVCALAMLTDSFPLDAIGPIVVAAQSNFAIDQLLAQAKYLIPTAKFVRLGSRCRVDHIRERTLHILRGYEAVPNLAGRGWIRKAEKAIAAFLRLNNLTEPLPCLLDPKVALLAGLITERQCDSIITPAEAEFDLVRPGDDEPLESYPPYPTGSFADWLGRDQIFLHPGMVYHPPANQAEPRPEAAADESSDSYDRRILFEENEDEQNIRGLCVPLVGRYWTGVIKRQFAATWRTIAARELRDNQKNGGGDLYNIPVPHRGLVYRYIQEKLAEGRAAEFAALVADHAAARRAIADARCKADAELLKNHNIRIIGCTTTGLGKYRALLAATNAKVMMVEEAAETWEANVTSAILPSLQQLILVGDHVQLTPSCHVRGLMSPPWNINLSLFERLIGRGVPHLTLEYQRRMFPTIRRLIAPHYPNIKDHPSVLDLSPVPGVPVRTYFFHTDHPDTQNANKSRHNIGEAHMVLGLYKYLLLNAMRPREITILTFYKAQQTILRDLLLRDPMTRNMIEDNTRLNVRTVDSYQGEETDVVILSLVRSADGRNGADSRNPAGFLSNKNRVVVAMSRAMRGLYIFGNAATLSRDDRARDLWAPITRVLAEAGAIGTRFPIVCQNHGTAGVITSPEDWDRSYGGCQAPCGDVVCDEGHPCPRKCHILPCQWWEGHGMPCSLILSCGHKCRNGCGEAHECPVEDCDNNSHFRHLQEADRARDQAAAAARAAAGGNDASGGGIRETWIPRDLDGRRGNPVRVPDGPQDRTGILIDLDDGEAGAPEPAGGDGIPEAPVGPGDPMMGMLHDVDSSGLLRPLQPSNVAATTLVPACLVEMDAGLTRMAGWAPISPSQQQPPHVLDQTAAIETTDHPQPTTDAIAQVGAELAGQSAADPTGQSAADMIETDAGLLHMAAWTPMSPSRRPPIIADQTATVEIMDQAVAEITAEPGTEMADKPTTTKAISQVSAKTTGQTAGTETTDQPAAEITDQAAAEMIDQPNNEITDRRPTTEIISDQAAVEIIDQSTTDMTGPATADMLDKAAVKTIDRPTTDMTDPATADMIDESTLIADQPATADQSATDMPDPAAADTMARPASKFIVQSESDPVPETDSVPSLRTNSSDQSTRDGSVYSPRLLGRDPDSDSELDQAWIRMMELLGSMITKIQDEGDEEFDVTGGEEADGDEWAYGV